MSYQQLTEGRRYQISVLLDLGISIALIAKAINCHRATVYGELKRCHALLGYCPDSTQASACKMRRHSAKYTIPDTRINFVRFLLQHDWSPEQISRVLSGMNQAVSHEWIYRFVQGGKVISAIAEVKKIKRQRSKMVPLSTLDLPLLIPVSVW